MAQLTPRRRSRDVVYRDSENGISVTLDHVVTKNPNTAALSVQSEKRTALLNTLYSAVATAQTQTNQLPNALPVLQSNQTQTRLQTELPNTELVALVIHPAPDSNPVATVTNTLFTLLAGLVNDSPKHTIACEIVATSSQIQFQLVVPAELVAITTQQLYATYPSAHIELQAIETSQSTDVAQTGTTISMRPADAPLRISDDSTTDPLHALLENLAHLTSNETLHIQFVVSSLVPVTPLAMQLVQSIGQVVRGRFIPKTTSEEPDNPKVTEAIAQVTIRLLAGATTSERADTLVQAATAPFYQWVQPGGAQLKRQQPKKVAKFIQAFDRRTADHSLGFLITAPELASLYHLPATVRAHPKLAALESVHLAPPALANQDNGLLIGTSRYRDHESPVVITPENRLRHLYLIGQTGTGKSSLFQSLFLQDVLRGEGGCFIDPHGEAVDWLLARIPKHRLNDVVLFDPSQSDTALGLNLLEWRTPEQRDLLIQELILLFYKLFDPDHAGIIGPQFEHWLRSAALTVTEPSIRGTLADIPRLFTDERYQRWAAKRVTHPAAKRFWDEQMAQTSAYHRSEMLNYFTSKFGAFLGNATMAKILNQQHSAFDLRSLMDNRKILLVNLSKGNIGDLNASLLGTILVTKLQLAAMSRANLLSSERVPFYAYLDEFHSIATDSFTTLLSEIRKYGVALHLTHQYVKQLSDPLKDAILGNVGTLLAFRLGHDDAQWLESYFQPLTAEDLTHVSAYHFHCRTLVNGATSNPFTVQAYHADPPAQPAVVTITRARMQAASALIALAELTPKPSRSTADL